MIICVGGPIDGAHLDSDLDTIHVPNYCDKKDMFRTVVYNRKKIKFTESKHKTVTWELFLLEGITECEALGRMINNYRGENHA